MGKKDEERDDQIKMLKKEITLLKSEIEARKEERQLLEYRLDVVSDMSRLKVAGNVLASTWAVATEEDLGTLVDSAIDVANELVDRYEAIMKEKAEAFHQAVMKAQEEEAKLERENNEGSEH